MKRLLFLLSCILAISLTACSSSKDDTNDFKASDLKGYWMIDSSYSGDGGYCDNYAFYFDGEDSWTGLNEKGEENNLFGSATVEDGKLKLEGILVDQSVDFTISSAACLKDADGNIVYLRTKYPDFNSDEDTVKYDVFSTWLLMSNQNSYLKLNSDGTCERYDADYDETTTSTYTVNEYETSAPDLNGTSVGGDYTSVQIEFDDESFSPDLTLITDTRALVSASGDDLYIRLNELESDYALDAIYRANMVAREWKNDTDYQAYFFFENKAVAYMSDSESGVVEYTGKWALDDNQVSILWNNGQIETAYIEDLGTYCTLTFDEKETVFDNKSIWDN